MKYHETQALLFFVALYTWACPVQCKDRFDRTFSKIVKSHWNVSNTGTPMMLEAKFTTSSDGSVKVLSMVNLLPPDRFDADESGGVNPLVEVSICDAIGHSGCEYAAKGQEIAGTYRGLFQTFPSRPHKVRIVLEIQK